MKVILLITILFNSSLFARVSLLPSTISGNDAVFSNTDNLCEHKTNKEEILTIVNSILNKNFEVLLPAYKDGRLKIREFENDEYFLKTMFKLSHILKKTRVYYLDINKKLYNCAPNKEALTAILAHELQHIDDYQKSKTFGLIRLGIKMVGKKSRSKYERSTDFRVMEMGYSEGIKGYRNWIYKRLDEKGLKTKKCYYYTPHEIDLYQEGQRDFSNYYKEFCKKKKD